MRRLNRLSEEAEARQVDADEALARKLQSEIEAVTETVDDLSLEPKTPANDAKPAKQTLAIDRAVAVFARREVEKQQQTAAEADNTCVICLDTAPTHIVVPCGHHCLCAGCASMKLDSCPMCKGAIDQIIKVFTVGN